MVKHKNKRKQSGLDIDGPAQKKIAGIVTPPPDGEKPKTIHAIGLHSDDLDIAIDALNTLAANPHILKSKVCKDIRTAVYQFQKACTTGFNASIDTNLTARISGALADGGYTDARILLAEMRIRRQTAKLGALCRWVRDLDVVSGLAAQLDEHAPSRTAKEEELLVVLDGILRLIGPTDYTVEENATPLTGPLIPRQAWNLRGNKTRRNVYDTVLDRSILSSIPPTVKADFRIIETIPALERKPANLHPAIVFTSRDNAIPLSSTPLEATHHRHPIVPNLHILLDVLAPEECTQIIAAAETIGFTPDAPVRAEGEESSVLAHNFYWLVDEAFHEKLWSRVEAFVPKEVSGKKVRGINRRFRVYRYVPGAEYRAHIDGAWPPSGINPATDEYIYDNSPPNAKQSSLFTFLIYLNDEFEAGETTFFLPSAREGSMNAYSVKPIQGSILLFPHGETDGSLLHEGTGVRQEAKQSAKYVIRTDVLYDVDASV